MFFFTSYYCWVVLLQRLHGPHRVDVRPSAHLRVVSLARLVARRLWCTALTPKGHSAEAGVARLQAKVLKRRARSEAELVASLHGIGRVIGSIDSIDGDSFRADAGGSPPRNAVPRPSRWTAGEIAPLSLVVEASFIVRSRDGRALRAGAGDGGARGRRSRRGRRRGMRRGGRRRVPRPRHCSDARRRVPRRDDAGREGAAPHKGSGIQHRFACGEAEGAIKAIVPSVAEQEDSWLNSEEKRGDELHFARFEGPTIREVLARW